MQGASKTEKGSSLHEAGKETSFQRAFREHRLIHVVCAMYAVFTLGQAVYCGAPFVEVARIFKSMGGVLIKCAWFFFAAGFVVYCKGWYSAFRKKPAFKKPFKDAWNNVGRKAEHYFTSETFAYACAGFFVVAAIHFLFLQKSLIDFINPYKWDPVLARTDFAVHFGHYPHSLITAFIDRFNLGRTLDYIYAAWFFVLYGSIAYAVLFDTHYYRRMQYTAALIFVWFILGSIMAVTLSSVGPLFYHDFYPKLPDIYRDLTDNFNKRNANFFVDFGRQWLFKWHYDKRMIDPNAFSAMPSMHVACSWMITLYARHFSRKLFWAMVLFTLSIVVGSVYFGYHYAIDGYVSIVGVTAIWCVTGIYFRRRMEKLNIPERIEVSR